MTFKELLDAAKKKRSEAKELIVSDAGGEEETIERAEALDKEAQTLERRAAVLKRSGPSSDAEEDSSDETGDAETRAPRMPCTAEVGDDLEKKRGFNCLGDMLIAVREATMTHGQTVNPILTYQQRAGTGANVSVPSEGGFGVQTDFVTSLTQAVDTNAQLAPRCRNLTVGASADAVELRLIDETSRVAGSRFGGVTASRVDEGGAGTASKPKIRKTRLELDKLMALYYATEEELRDGRTLTALAMVALPDEIAHVQDDEIWSGDGVLGALGVLSHASAVTVAPETSQTAKTVVLENLTKMRSRMPAKLRAGAAWYINQDVEASLHTLDWGTGTRPAFWPAGTLSGIPVDTLYGSPIIPIEQAETLGALGDISYMNLNEYLRIQKEGLRQDVSMHVEFLTDQMLFRFILRSNGMPLWYSPLTPQKGSNTQSPFVFLAPRA